MNFRLLKLFIVTCFLFLGIENSNAATCDWVGTTSGNWTLVGNWKNGVVPGSADIVQIGVLYNFTSQPNIPANTAVSISSLKFGCNYTTFNAITLSIKSGASLVVTNDITMQADAFSAAGGANTVNLSGAGTIQATNLNIISNYTGASSYTQTVNSVVTSLTLTGNIALTSSDNGTFTYNSSFLQSDNIVSVTGTLKTVNTANATSSFIVNPSGSSTGATLQLSNATALSSLSALGTNTVSFNNTLATIEYSGASQTVYSDLGITGLSSGIVYYSLKFSGTGVKTTNNGTYLTIYGDFTNALTNDASNYAALTNCTVRFIGSNSQNLYGGAGNGTTFKN